VRWSVALVAVTGCSQIFGLTSPVHDDASTSSKDAPPADALPFVDSSPPSVCVERWRATPSVSSPQSLPLNSVTNSERAPFVTEDGLELFFALDDEVHRATRLSTTTAFANENKVGSLSSGSLEGKTFISIDKLRAFFVSGRAGGDGGLDIWRGARSSPNNNFNTDQMYLGNVNSGSNDIDPHLSADLLRIYFATTVGAQQVLAVASRQSINDPFGQPASFAEIATTTSVDSGPTLTADERVIVFSSARISGPAGTNLWYATRADRSQPFGAPQLVPTVNSEQFDETPHISEDGCTIYFASSRNGTFDLFSAQIQ
jgi:Tol biopolymer transport system component